MDSESLNDCNQIKQKILYTDGGLRDILIYDTTLSDWNKYFEFLSLQYHVEYIYEKAILDMKSFKDLLFEFWSNNKSTFDFVIHIYPNEEYYITSWCNDFDKIEQDFSPEEFRNDIDCKKLVQYLTSLANALKKDVLITTEMDSNEVLAKFYPNSLN
jgi:hypothetical protein